MPKGRKGGRRWALLQIACLGNTSEQGYRKKKATPIWVASVFRGEPRPSLTGAAHNPDNKIAIGAVIQVKTRQGASFSVSAVVLTAFIEGEHRSKKKRQRYLVRAVPGNGDLLPALRRADANPRV